MKDTWRHEVYEIRFMNFVDLKNGCVMCKLIDGNCWKSFIKRARNDPLQVHGPFRTMSRCMDQASTFVSVRVLRDTDQSCAPFFGSGGWCEDKSSRKQHNP